MYTHFLDVRNAHTCIYICIYIYIILSMHIFIHKYTHTNTHPYTFVNLHAYHFKASKHETIAYIIYTYIHSCIVSR